ncbi:hypothetical protein [Labilibaculum sp.]|uniref:hypothetical protein n=1 Tax=Labilibaculum sp. TaxID=2060723 RepID=UPI003565EFE1
MYNQIYAKLEKLGIREFQIHLRDGEQFIYSKEIDQLGTNLFYRQFSVELANTRHIQTKILFFISQLLSIGSILPLLE